MLVTWLGMLGFPTRTLVTHEGIPQKWMGKGTMAVALAPKVQEHLKLERKVLWAQVDLLLLFCFVAFLKTYL